MKLRRILVMVIALLSTAVGFAQNERPGPDPLQRAVSQARNAGNLGMQKNYRAGFAICRNAIPKARASPLT